ncbi:MAG TPA: hypothetical protein VML55_09895 [Planctomycetaceae bacterium]|nr:hypothetical protein [Planctomycetaceae bacterium]
MTRPRAAFWMTATLLAGFGLATADAQSPGRARTGPYDRPTISPYTTLLGLDQGNLVREYYRRVRPELELRNAATQFSRSIQGLQRQVDQQRDLIQSETSQIGATGHATFFQNHRRYFGAGRR